MVLIVRDVAGDADSALRTLVLVIGPCGTGDGSESPPLQIIIAEKGSTAIKLLDI
jgi:hypothetical protein